MVEGKVEEKVLQSAQGEMVGRWNVRMVDGGTLGMVYSGTVGWWNGRMVRW